MRFRITILIIAVLFGLFAVYLINSYVANMGSRFKADAKTTEILTAAETLPAGLTLVELKERKMLVIKKMPREFISAGALFPKTDLKDKVLAYSMEKGEQLTRAKFKTPQQAGLAYLIPQNYIAISLPVDDVRGISNMLKIGDYVNVIVTFDKNNQPFTRTLLQKARVLAVGSKLEREIKQSGSIEKTLSGKNEQPAESAKKTVTLAVSTEEAEKLVFSEEQGRVWLALMPSPESPPVTTVGQTLETLF